MEKRNNDNWVRCPYCKHKLFKRLVGADALIEIKCSSCKRIFELNLDEEGKEDSECESLY